MEQLPLGVIRAFLEGHGYQFKRSWNKVEDTYTRRGVLIGRHQDRGHVTAFDLQACLEHFLCGELGRKWKEAWEHDKLGCFYEAVFTQEEFVIVQEAILFYEDLEKAQS